jgi:hypothetical protein
MSKKFKMPKISKEEIEELTRACQFAFGDPEADEFFDQVMAKARHYSKLRPACGEQTRTEYRRRVRILFEGSAWGASYRRAKTLNAWNAKMKIHGQ